MGNRANFVIVKDQKWQLYYSHWAGCRTLDALVCGPEFALRYVRSLRKCDKDEWVGPLWADGGVMIDLDRRHVLFFGDELMVEMAERRALMEVLSAIWIDYSVNWAYDGTDQLAAYVRAELPPQKWDRRPTLRLAYDANALCHLVSVVDAAGQVRMWPLWWGFSQAWRGPALIDELPGGGVPELVLAKIPEGGVHIDVSRKTVGAWHTADTMGIFRALAEIWAGWQTECWEDRFEEQARRCRGALRLPKLDLVAAIDTVRVRVDDRVFQSFADSPSGHIMKLAGMLAPLGPGLVVSDDALHDLASRPNEGEWARFVNACYLLQKP